MRKTIHSEQYRIFITALRDARERAGVTQVDLAKKLRVEQSVVSKCERGARRLDVVELHEWLHALDGDALSFISELFDKLDAHATLQASSRRRKQ